MTARVAGNADIIEDVMDGDGAARTVGGRAMVVAAGRTTTVANSRAIAAAIIDPGSRSETLYHGSRAWSSQGSGKGV